MRLRDFIRRNETVISQKELSKKLDSMKCRKLSFVDTDFKQLIDEMKISSKTFLTLKPVNYYAVKNQYILASVYTSEDFKENYIKFQRFDFEKKTDESEIFSLDLDTLSRCLAKVGIIINIENINS